MSLLLDIGDLLFYRGFELERVRWHTFGDNELVFCYVRGRDYINIMQRTVDIYSVIGYIGNDMVHSQGTIESIHDFIKDKV